MLNTFKTLTPGTGSTTLHCVGEKHLVSGVKFYMKKEKWKDIRGYEGLYKISNLGRVKSLWPCRRGSKPRILKNLKQKVGYSGIELCKNKKHTRFNIHRLVGIAFIKNPLNKPQVNHINGVKTDNRVENLDWCTRSENEYHSYRALGKKAGLSNKFGKLHPASRPVIQLDKENNYVAEFECAADAARKCGFSEEGIRLVCMKKTNSSGGFRWVFKKEYQLVTSS